MVYHQKNLFSCTIPTHLPSYQARRLKAVFYYASFLWCSLKGTTSAILTGTVQQCWHHWTNPAEPFQFIRKAEYLPEAGVDFYWQKQCWWLNGLLLSVWFSYLCSFLCPVPPASQHTAAPAFPDMARRMEKGSREQRAGHRQSQVADGRWPGGAAGLSNELWTLHPSFSEYQQIPGHVQQHPITLHSQALCHFRELVFFCFVFFNRKK